MCEHICDYFTDWIRSKDEITKPISTRLHLAGEKNSFVGGFVSLGISIYMLWLIYDKSYDMFTYVKPRTGTRYSDFNIDKKILWEDLGRTTLTVTDSNHGFPFKHVSLGEVSDRYISVRAQHIEVTFDADGKE